MHHLPQNWIITGLAVVGVGILLSFLIEFIAAGLDKGEARWARAVRRRLGVAEGKPILELRWITLMSQLVLWPVAGYVLLHVWGLHDLGRSFFDALLGGGFKIGSTQIVPGKILLGLFAFVLLFTFTRWFKRKLENDWLPLTRMEPSVRMSLATLFGYATFTLAALIGLSAAGLDLSKIAIVAGALSVGIGFGLQNIVNNFVSGLILLFERPVRVGDTIKVSGTEGVVRSIRIRATELQTGDHISVLVPNSVLLSSALENLNYRDNIGAATVNVIVTYDTEPEQVRTLLLQAAADHPQVIRQGQRYGVSGPVVLLKDFGERGLSFDLVVNVREIGGRGVVASDLRFAIHRAFREKGVEIPVTQRAVLMRAAAETHEEAAAEDGV
jgi:small-conductance mechanosensitive channel